MFVKMFEIMKKIFLTATVLKYRLPNRHHEIPPANARRAIRVVREREAVTDWIARF